jgi:membrane associated rhomboid family serine protease
MFPIGDDNSSRMTAPVVVYALIALKVAFFFAELNGGDPFIVRWAFVPRRFLADPAGGFVTVFMSMFMHGGRMRLGGNMLYLWIFRGDGLHRSRQR